MESSLLNSCTRQVQAPPHKSKKIIKALSENIYFKSSSFLFYHHITAKEVALQISKFNKKNPATL